MGGENKTYVNIILETAGCLDMLSEWQLDVTDAEYMRTLE